LLLRAGVGDDWFIHNEIWLRFLERFRKSRRVSFGRANFTSDRALLPASLFFSPITFDMVANVIAEACEGGARYVDILTSCGERSFGEASYPMDGGAANQPLLPAPGILQPDEARSAPLADASEHPAGRDWRDLIVEAFFLALWDNPDFPLNREQLFETAEKAAPTANGNEVRGFVSRSCAGFLRYLDGARSGVTARTETLVKLKYQNKGVYNRPLIYDSMLVVLSATRDRSIGLRRFLRFVNKSLGIKLSEPTFYKVFGSALPNFFAKIKSKSDQAC
jgi:hypothetical protein